MSKILGLDLGTNSIGWAVVDNERNNFKTAEYNNQPTKGVVIFPEGVKKDKGNEKSRAAERTTLRGARRLKYRRKIRKYRTLFTLSEVKMCPLNTDEVESWKNSGFKKYPINPDFINWLRTDNHGDRDNPKHKEFRRQQKENPYYFRDKYSRKKYDWENSQELAYELGRAFYHLAQRRGFKSNRLEQTDENIIADIKDQIQIALDDCKDSVILKEKIGDIYSDYEFDNKTNDDLDATEQKLKRIKGYIYKVLNNKIKNQDYKKYEDAKNEIDRYINKPENLGPVLGGIKELTENIQNTPDCKTLGQYFWHLYQNDRNNPKFKIRNNYTHREEHYEEEFNVICEKQKMTESLKIKLYKAIFFQRPLKSQKGLIGKCTFEKNKPRCPISRPEFEEYRMWAFINNIKIKTPSDEQLRPLTLEEKKQIIPKFYRQKSTFKFEELADTLNKTPKFVYFKDRESKNADFIINYKLNTTVTGCPVSAAFKSIFGESWRTDIYNNNKNGEPIYLYDIAWHVIFTFNDKEKLEEFATENLRLDKTKSKMFSKITPKQGYANLSLKAINKILPWLEKGLIFSHAVFMANLDNVVDKDKWTDKATREIIENEIKEIIENHIDETRKCLAINSIIKNLKDDDIEKDYINASDFKDDLLNKLKSIFGEKSWIEKSDQDEYFNDAYNILKEQIKKINTKQAFAKVKRIDERVIEFLLDNNLVTDKERIKNLYHPSDIEDFKPVKDIDYYGNDIKILPFPKTDAIKNPVLIRAMYQLRKLINELLKQGVIDDKTKIHVELAREVNDTNQRAAWKTWQDKLRDKNIEIEQILSELFNELGKTENISDEDIKKTKIWSENLFGNDNKSVNVFDLTKDKKELIQKYNLWKEQKCICIYTGKSISLTQLFEGTSFDIEHTIPRSLSWDNSMMNKTIADSKFNREIKKNQIPSQLIKHNEILQRIEHWKEKIDKLDKDIKKINASNITDPEIKSRTIQKRHLLKFEYEYWKGKYDRFTMEEVPEGFKNSQISDTGLITRFARKYLSCLFRTESGNSNVFVVNGLAVDQFRRAWGLQEEYKKKERKNHIHHCIDAVTIACMTKDKYDAFAEEWRKQEDDYIKYGTVKKLKIEKPWNSFTGDVKNLENEVLIVHTHKNNAPKQTKKKLRKRGKIQYRLSEELPKEFHKKIEEKDYFKINKDGKVFYKLPIYIKGDTVRGSLHQDTLYAAIKQPEIDKETNNPLHSEDGSQFILKKDKKGNDIITYVTRPQGKLSSLSDSDLDKIIDPKIHKIVIQARKKEKILRKEIEELKKKLKTLDETQQDELKKQISSIQYEIDHKLYVIPPRNNKDKLIPIYNARIKAHLSEPLPNFKKQKDIKKDINGIEKYPYKNWIYVQNDENYGLAIFENEDGSKRLAEIIKLIDAADYFKNSNRDFRKSQPIVMNEKKGMKLKGILKPGNLVLFYEDNPDEIWNFIEDKNQDDIRKRLYYVRKTSKDGRVTFQFHQEARNDNQLKEDYKTNYAEDAPQSLTNGESKIDFNRLPIPRLLLSPGNMNMLIEGIDFRIKITGVIEKINSKNSYD